MGLTAQQWQFIAARLLTSTDYEAAEQLGIDKNTPSRWKRDSEEFAQEYEASFRDGVDVAKKYTRKQLGKAADVLRQQLEAKDKREPDNFARLKAVEILFKSHGILADKHVVTIEKVSEWADKIAAVIDECVSDSEVKAVIGQRIREVFCDNNSG